LILEQPKVFRIAMLSVMDLLKHKIFISTTIERHSHFDLTRRDETDAKW
jgi:hypothetical protein